MKTEETITPLNGRGAGAGPLGSHAFLDEFALAYHRAVARLLRAEPETVLEQAQRNLNRWTEADEFGVGERASFASEEGQCLRSSSPFVGALSPEERLEILAACEQLRGG